MTVLFIYQNICLLYYYCTDCKQKRITIRLMLHNHELSQQAHLTPEFQGTLPNLIPKLKI
jgi:hypothetical protein